MTRVLIVIVYAPISFYPLSPRGRERIESENFPYYNAVYFQPPSRFDQS